MIGEKIQTTCKTQIIASYYFLYSLVWLTLNTLTGYDCLKNVSSRGNIKGKTSNLSDNGILYNTCIYEKRYM